MVSADRVAGPRPAAYRMGYRHGWAWGVVCGVCCGVAATGLGVLLVQAVASALRG